MVATLIVVPCTCHDLHDPGISERRAAHTGISAGRTQHKVVCAPGMSLLGSGDPCGNARGRQAKKRPCDRFVTMFPWHLFGLSLVAVWYDYPPMDSLHGRTQPRQDARDRA